MQRATFLAVLYVGLQCSSAVAQAPAEAPPVPPRFVAVVAIDQQNGEVTLSYHTVQFVLESAGETVVPKPVYETRSHILALDSAEFFDARGEKLTTDDVWKRIAVRKAVIVSADGKKIDRMYLDAIAKETLVIVSPTFFASSVPGPPSGTPGPDVPAPN